MERAVEYARHHHHVEAQPPGRFRDGESQLTVAAKCHRLEVPDVAAMNSATNSAAFSGQRSNPTWRLCRSRAVLPAKGE
jgi:hypothetical protein